MDIPHSSFYAVEAWMSYTPRYCQHNIDIGFLSPIIKKGKKNGLHQTPDNADANWTLDYPTQP